MPRYALRGTAIVDLDLHPELEKKPREYFQRPKKIKVATENRCERTKQSFHPVTYEEFANQCIKEVDNNGQHDGPHLYETT